MSLRNLSRASVLAAIREFDSLGRDEFLARYHFGPARAYFVLFDGKRYDSKAIAGAAHGYLPGCEPLLPKDFSGGDATVARTLGALDFEVQRDEAGSTQSANRSVVNDAQPKTTDDSALRKRPPPWAWPELVLACELTARHRWHELDVNHREVRELSELLRQLKFHPEAEHDDRFRSPGSVRAKMMNLSHCHPDSIRQGSNGGALDREVVKAFLDEPDNMRAYALELRRTVSAPHREDIAEAIDRTSTATPEDSNIGLAQFRPSTEEVLISAIRAHFRTRTNEQSRLLHDFQLSAVPSGLRLEKDSATGDLVLSRGPRRWVVAPKVVQNGNATAAVQTAVGSLTYTKHFLYSDANVDVVALFTEPIGKVYVDFLESLGIRAIWRVGDGWGGSPNAQQDRLVNSH